MKTEINGSVFDIGWCECASLPQLKIPAVEIQVVPNARFSLLSIFDLTTFKEGDDQMVSFGIHPVQNCRDIEIYAVAPAKSRRMIAADGKKRQWCYSIETQLCVGPIKKNIELFLVKDLTDQFKLRLAAPSLSRQLRVSPDQSHLISAELGVFPS